MASHKALAHGIIGALRPEDLKSVVVYGKASVPGFDKKRDVCQVTLTYTTEGGLVFVGTGIAYRNPSDTPNRDFAYMLAWGRAELALGMQLFATLLPSDFNNDKARALFQGAHRILGESAWEVVRKRRRRALKKNGEEDALPLGGDTTTFEFSAKADFAQQLLQDVQSAEQRLLKGA